MAEHLFEFAVHDHLAERAAILKHFEEHRGKPGPLALQEIVRGDPPIALHVVPPSKNCDGQTLFTVGMSDKPLKLPDGSEMFAELGLRPADHVCRLTSASRRIAAISSSWEGPVMARGQRDRGKEQHWQEHVAAWRRSGQSVRAYCRAEGLSEPSFYSWRRVLARRDGGAAARSGGGGDNAAAVKRPRRARSAMASPFVPVRLVPDAAPAADAAVEVVLRGGRVVRVAAGFAAQTLREVVAALEDVPC